MKQIIMALVLTSLLHASDQTIEDNTFRKQLTTTIRGTKNFINNHGKTLLIGGAISGIGSGGLWYWLHQQYSEKQLINNAQKKRENRKKRTKVVKSETPFVNKSFSQHEMQQLEKMEALAPEEQESFFELLTDPTSIVEKKHTTKVVKSEQSDKKEEKEEITEDQSCGSAVVNAVNDEEYKNNLKKQFQDFKVMKTGDNKLINSKRSPEPRVGLELLNPEMTDKVKQALIGQNFDTGAITVVGEGNNLTIDCDGWNVQKMNTARTSKLQATLLKAGISGSIKLRPFTTPEDQKKQINYLFEKPLSDVSNSDPSFTFRQLDREDSIK